MRAACALTHSVMSISLVTPRTVAHQGPLSMGFSRQNTGLGCHFLLQGISLTQGLNPRLLYLLHWQVGSLPLHHLRSTNKEVAYGRDNLYISEIKQELENH